MSEEEELKNTDNRVKNEDEVDESQKSQSRYKSKFYLISTIKNIKKTKSLNCTSGFF